MIVTGLNSDRYLTGNPIPLTLRPDSGYFGIGAKITMTVARLVTHTGDVEYTYPPVTLFASQNATIIDLRPYMIGMMPEPYIPSNTYQNPVPNYQKFNITFHENQNDTSVSFLGKTFIRGFERRKSSSGITLSIGEELREGERIPMWEGYPIARFYIDGSSRILPDIVVAAEHIKRMRTPNACDPFYVRFLNTKGGYSFWMFNAWEHETKSKELGVIKRTTAINNKSLGFSEENTVTVDTRVRREYFGLIRALIVSPVIQVYDQFDMEWLKIELQETTFDTNNYDDLQEFTCEFDLMLSISPGTIW